MDFFENGRTFLTDFASFDTYNSYGSGGVGMGILAGTQYDDLFESWVETDQTRRTSLTTTTSGQSWGPSWNSFGIDRMLVQAASGGTDTAEFSLAAGEEYEQVVVDDVNLSRASAGHNKYNYSEVDGRWGIEAHATLANNNIANITKTDDDAFAFTFRHTYEASSEGGNYSALDGFGNVYLDLSASSNNVVNIYDDPTGNDTFTSHPTYCGMTGAGYHYRVDGSAPVNVYASGNANDRANFHDSTHNDTFWSNGSNVPLDRRHHQHRDRPLVTANTFYAKASGFPLVYAYRTSGYANYDTAYFRHNVADKKATFSAGASRAV